MARGDELRPRSMNRFIRSHGTRPRPARRVQRLCQYSEWYSRVPQWHSSVLHSGGVGSTIGCLRSPPGEELHHGDADTLEQPIDAEQLRGAGIKLPARKRVHLLVGGRAATDSPDGTGAPAGAAASDGSGAPDGTAAPKGDGAPGTDATAAPGEGGATGAGPATPSDADPTADAPGAAAPAAAAAGTAEPAPPKP